ncbi:heterogeneous nuclear ribonucleoprotein H2-like isoform X2 [Anthonomus grandis grandis]|uniref:heterogeneous nuclear ribonucleoprotein H2-like isoform X2 n=1 Tax=Anthonomus grandis grandis TaxID=2921223 RepID=UPI002165332A|nr:heterogeneous nuclear ribonucleoprotein H2-like isoform X2 [Anthonomus grandis grandis]
MEDIKTELDMNNTQETEDEGFIVKLRGLPWSATADDITKFLGEDGIKRVQLTLSKEGRPSGEAFVELETEEDLHRAEKKDKDHMGSRYIEVFKVNRAEMEWVMKRSGNNASVNEDGCVRLRGLPFGCSKEEIAQFFTGLEIVANGITLLTDFSGRSSGEAYVQFANREVAERALQKHREKIGHRYIEIFRSSLAEVSDAMGGGYGGGRGGMPPRGGPPSMFGARPGPYDRGDRFGGGGVGGARFPARGSRSFKSVDAWGGPPQNGGPPRGMPMNNKRFDDDFDYDTWSPPNRPVQNHCIHMRGLPFKATQQDIAEFFRPVIPMTIHILTEPSGRPSGEADVCFASHEDALKAMSKDKSHMQHRYIELFLNSSGAGMAAGIGRFRR